MQAFFQFDAIELPQTHSSGKTKTAQNYYLVFFLLSTPLFN